MGIKKLFSKKPKRCVWFYVAAILFIGQLITSTNIAAFVGLQTGLHDNGSFDQNGFVIAGQEVGQAYTTVLQKSYMAGTLLQASFNATIISWFFTLIVFTIIIYLFFCLFMILYNILWKWVHRNEEITTEEAEQRC
jgi:membrane protein implicated in regulation of membrane protease activity